MPGTGCYTESDPLVSKHAQQPTALIELNLQWKQVRMIPAVARCAGQDNHKIFCGFEEAGRLSRYDKSNCFLVACTPCVLGTSKITVATVADIH